MTKENEEDIKKGEIDMAILAINKPNMFTIKRNKAKAFIEDSNKQKISEEFLKECQEAAKMFRQK